MVEPLGALLLTLTTKVKVALAPAARVAAVAVKLPVPRARGVVKVKAGPLGCVADTNVVLVGMTSERFTSRASERPALVTVIVYVRFVPATTGSGESVLVTWMSS